MNEALRQTLLAMRDEDRRVRAELAATGELFEGYAPRMEEVHRRNARALESIVEQHGWPGRSLVGEEGAEAAWLILQHAIGAPGLQRRCLPVLWEEAARGEVEPAQAAHLEDRVRFFERRPQRFGTHFDWDESGEMSPWTIEEPERVDDLRRCVGLRPLAEQVEKMREGTAGEPPPTDLKRRQEEMLAWARSVGWL
ncbi:MAG TPA: DUF6624 domain-containing protein [Pyrinomonadaceae bacterium]|nr:DUF6624 domain-containing protein [Pyrinomonadaceae bacterium]